MRRFIVHVCRTGWPVVGGMETAIHGLARAQVAAGHRVEVVTLQYALDDGRGLPHVDHDGVRYRSCLLYTSPSPRDKRQSRMPSSA